MLRNFVGSDTRRRRSGFRLSTLRSSATAEDGR